MNVNLLFLFVFSFSQKFVQNLSAKWSLDDQPWSNWCRGLSEKLLYSFTLLFFKDCPCDDNKKRLYCCRAWKMFWICQSGELKEKSQYSFLASLTRINLLCWLCCSVFFFLKATTLYSAKPFCQTWCLSKGYTKAILSAVLLSLFFFFLFFPVRNRHFWLAGWLLTRMQRVTAGVLCPRISKVNSAVY